MKQTEVDGRFPGERCPPGSRVSFRRRGETVVGEVAELRKQVAIVGAGGRGRWRVGYSLLTVLSRAAGNGQPLAATLALAAGLVERHGLGGGSGRAGWRVALDTSARRAGQCNFNRRTIYLAVGHCLLAPVAEVRDTILHEIAHALVGPRHGHDPVWQRTALAIGCKATRCHAGQHAAARWTGRCLCAKTWQRRQLSRKARSGRCPRCKQPIAWRVNTGGMNGPDGAGSVGPG